MTLQTSLIAVETKAVKMDGIVWIIKGTTLYMTDDEGKQWTPFEPGSETYRYKFKQLNSLKPLPETERLTIISKLLNNVKEMM